jgi:O-methyltransferase
MSKSPIIWSPSIFELTEFERDVYNELEKLFPYNSSNDPGVVQSPCTVATLMREVERVCKTNVNGDFVECGVYKGASQYVMIRTLTMLGVERDLWLYDTFSGMPADVVEEGFWPDYLEVKDDNDWMRGTLDDVRNSLLGLNYPEHRLKFVCGKVEETLLLEPNKPQQIAILRLDTDFYSSTRTELEQLYSRVSIGGTVIIDDYGAFQSCKGAVDEFTAGKISLHEIDNRVVMWVKAE